MARRAGCPESGPGLKICLKALPLDQLLATYSESHVSAVYGDDFNPVSVRESLATGKHLHTEVNLLVGTVADEGSLLVASDAPELLDPPGAQDISLEEAKRLILKFWKHRPLVAEVEKLYLDRGNSSAAGLPLRDAVLQSLSDGFLGCATQNFARALTNVYGYYFRSGVTSRLMFRPAGLREPVLRPCHGADIPLVFGQPLVYGNFTSKERDYYELMMKIFGSFVRTGDPSLDASHDLWRPFEAAAENVVVIVMELNEAKPDKNLLRFNPRAERCEMWSRHAQQICWKSADQILSFGFLRPDRH